MLLDPAYADLRVDKLVTLGQGLGLSWRLAADPDVRDITPGHRLVGDLARTRPGLRWVDVWASFDPAPAGPIPIGRRGYDRRRCRCPASRHRPRHPARSLSNRGR